MATAPARMALTRANRKKQGLKRLEVWCRPSDHARIKAYAQKLLNCAGLLWRCEAVPYHPTGRLDVSALPVRVEHPFAAHPREQPAKVVHFGLGHWEGRGVHVARQCHWCIQLPATELPRWKCHKEVWALKIESVVHASIEVPERTDGSAVIVPADKRYAPFRVDAVFVGKHDPKPGGYYVVYDDGYKSYSPAKAFEGGYSPV